MYYMCENDLVFSLIDSFLAPARLLFPSGAPRPIRNIRTPRKQVETIVVGLSDLSPRLARTVPSCAHYFQAPAKQAKL